MPGTSDTIATGAPAARPVSQRVAATYHALILRGFGTTEAANLVAYLNGLPVRDVSWTLGEVNRMLFLRHRHQSGRLAEAEQLPEMRAA